MLYLAKGVNTFDHVKGKNVYYMTNNINKFNNITLLSKIEEFRSHNDLLSSIHNSRLNIIKLS